MATFQHRAPSEYRVEEHRDKRTHGSIWRWLIPLVLGLLALWGLFGRRDHRPTLDDAREPTRMPYENSRP